MNTTPCSHHISVSLTELLREIRSSKIAKGHLTFDMGVDAVMKVARAMLQVFVPPVPSPDSPPPAPMRTFQMDRMHDLARFSAGLDPKLWRVLGPCLFKAKS